MTTNALRARMRALVRAGTRRASTPLPVDLVLEARSARSVHVRAVPFSLACLEGCVWVTHPADPGDHLIPAGRAFAASGPGHLVVVTFVPSRIRLTGRCRVGG